MVQQPLILTLRLDATSTNLLTSLRTKYFPKHINFLASHVTIFHALPSCDANNALYEKLLTDLTAREHPFTVGIKNPFILGKRGRGVALNIASFKLKKLHEGLVRELEGEGVQLTDQDRAGLRPHVTVQNKVSEEEAKKTFAELEAFEERAGKGEALALWRYEVGGRWTFLREFVFGWEARGGEGVERETRDENRTPKSRRKLFTTHAQ